MRAELLSIEQLKRFARDLARQDEVEVGPGHNRLLSRLADNARALREAHEVLVDADAAGRRMSPPAEWLLDNSHLIEQQIQLARLHLPRGYSQLLPRLKQGPMKGLPRVYGMAFELISHLDGLLDVETTTTFVASYQTVAPLNLGELWAFPIALRLGLIENLRRVAAGIANRRREQDDGIAWAERTLSVAEKEPKQLVHLLAEFADTHPTLGAPFLEEFVKRLQGQGVAVAFILNWIDQALAEEGATVTERLQADGHTQAAEHLSIANSIGSLRFLAGMDWKSFVEAQSRVEQILRRDPARAYAAQDFATRDHYRHIGEQLAIRSGRPETEIAQAALEMAAAAPDDSVGNRARHVGAYLVGGERTRFRRAVGCPWSLPHACGLLVRRYRLLFYLSGIAAGALVAAAGPVWCCAVSWSDWRFWPMVLAALVPASTLSVSLVNFLVTLRVPPHPLPRLDFSSGIPPQHRTMVVVPALMPDDRTLARLLEALEIRYLGNRDPQLLYALLTDFPDAGQETLPGDGTLLRHAREGIEQLNARHARADGGTTFYLFHRPRVWNRHERCWMGYERKRGKIEQFNALLRGGPPEAFALTVGDVSALSAVKYVITLDADTDLPRGAAHRMVGALAHPLNRPRFDAASGRVVEGYAILQPRVSVRLEAANRSIYARLCCGQTGLDPYSQEVSDVYQDLFSEGTYVGKGIYDVDAFRQALDGRFPENLILSHDLLESCYARSGLLGCVEVYEDTPASYLGEINRQHRWMRGDWQIARWLGPLPPVNKDRHGRQPISLLSQWKILDNLRRSLFAPALLALLIAGWTVGPVAAAAWTIFAFASVGLTSILRSITLLLRKPRERGLRLHLRTWSLAVLRHCAQPLFELCVLPYETTIAVGAFGRSALRLPFTRRGLLIWHLAQYRRREARSTLGGFVVEMWFAPAWALLSIALTTCLRAAALPDVLPLAALWLLAPASAWWISRPIRHRAPALSAVQRRLLRTLACRTWRYFETFVCEREHWLPPDNFQEVPDPAIASRTSPTNIGFALVVDLAAWDFGYLSTARMLERIRLTLDTVEKLERYRGHLFNWYDTRTLKPLPPRYVSSVDSGNLMAALITLRAGLREMRDRPAMPPQLWRGLSDTLAVMIDEAGAVAAPDFIETLRAAEFLLVAPPAGGPDAVDRLRAVLAAAVRLKEAANREPHAGLADLAGFLERQCRDHAQAVECLADAGQPKTTLLQLARGHAEPAGTAARANAAAMLETLDRLAERCHALQAGMDFRFLYNTQRDLLSIGFDTEARRLDPSCYDLLASESRMASFLMIADEQAPPEHWFALGRLLAGHGGTAALVSWSGSMFEYLMPNLLMTDYPGTLLAQTCRSAIERQIRYGRQRHIPWGISESCYHATDAHHVYQYRAFGVPGLGLKRGLSDDLVVAPYATLLALPFDPPAACENLERLIGHEEALGEYGLFEAIDYTPARVLRGRTRAVVRCYMSHHQGMSLLALSHLLLNAPMVRRFMSEPAIRATEMLLQERVPDVAPAIHPHTREAAVSAVQTETDAGATMRVFSNPQTAVPEVHLLSNGRYHVMVTQAGGGYSRWNGLALTRWREDATRDNWGACVYLRDMEAEVAWSCAHQPVGRPADRYEAIFTQGRAEYRRRDLDVETHTEICVSPEDDVEIRRITLANRSRRERRI
ncbi:MAG: glucoamylase family protein, partial [Kiritimatiellae bacterium]|nr:glucoamylase family protein [Kiritimatiellia bacterium]